MRMPSLVAAAVLASAACALPVQAQAQQFPTRINVDILYRAGGDAALEQNVKQWATALGDKLKPLAWDTSLGLSALGSINVMDEKLSINLNANNVASRWNNHNSIQVIFGTGRRDGSISRFEGNIYLGTLRGTLPISIPISQGINGAGYEHSTNFMVVVTLYALSQDSTARRSVRCGLLQRARQLASPIPQTLMSVGLVKTAIRTALPLQCARKPA